MTAFDRFATVVVDMQNDYVADGGVLARAGMDNAAAKAAVPRVRDLVEFSRAQGIPVVWVTMVWDADSEVGVLAERSPFLRHEGLRRNTWGARLVDGLEVRQKDYVVEKKRFSAFYQTRLEALLHSLNVTHILVAGVRSDFCVESTVRDAFFRDFRVTIARDCVAGYLPELHENSLRVMGTVFAQVRELDEIKTLVAPTGVTARG